jgi:hypothetical protein
MYGGDRDVREAGVMQRRSFQKIFTPIYQSAFSNVVTTASRLIS